MKEMSCGCRYNGVGKPMDNTFCKPWSDDPNRKIHDRDSYKCDVCSCTNYRTWREPIRPDDWPHCVCGHSAQDHN